MKQRTKAWNRRLILQVQHWYALNLEDLKQPPVNLSQLKDCSNPNTRDRMLVL